MASIPLALNIVALCATLAGVETLHGILRNALVAPRIGTKRAKKLSLISGTMLLFIVCYFWVPRLGLGSSKSLLLRYRDKTWGEGLKACPVEG